MLRHKIHIQKKNIDHSHSNLSCIGVNEDNVTSSSSRIILIICLIKFCKGFSVFKIAGQMKLRHAFIILIASVPHTWDSPLQFAIAVHFLCVQPLLFGDSAIAA